MQISLLVSANYILVQEKQVREFSEDMNSKGAETTGSEQQL